MGDRRLWALLAAVVLTVSACNDASPDPSLATGTTAPVTTASTTVTTTSPPTTVTEPPPTTEDPNERFAEIEALVAEAILGRLNAQYDKNPESLLRWVGSQRVYDRQLEAFDRNVWLQRPSITNYQVRLDEVLLDRDDCVVTLDSVTVGEGVIEGFSGSSTSISIWWPAPDGRFQLGAAWESSTPRLQWMEECDIAARGVTP